MKIYTCYGNENIPSIEVSHGSAGCPYCPDKKKIPKGQKQVYIAHNSGPTGRFFLCLKHAEELGKELIAVVESAKSKE